MKLPIINATNINSIPINMLQAFFTLSEMVNNWITKTLVSKT